MKNTTFYNRNGIILKKNSLEDDRFVELEFEFSRLIELNAKLLISILTLYMVLKEDQEIDYVMSSWTHQRCVVRKEDIDEQILEQLIDMLLVIKDRLGLVYRLADDYFYIDGNGGYIDTNKDFELTRYEVTKCLGKAFAENFSTSFV